MVNDNEGVGVIELHVVLNHDDVVKASAEALAGCATLRLMMERVTSIANRKLRVQDGELDGDVLSVVDVMSSMMIEALIGAADDDGDGMVSVSVFVSAYGKSNHIGLLRLAEFFELLVGQLDVAVEAAAGDETEAFMEWLVNDEEFGGVR